MLASGPLPTHRAPAHATSALGDPATLAALDALARRDRRPLLVFVGAMAVAATVLVGGLVFAHEAGWWAGGGVALMVATAFAVAEALQVGLGARKRGRWTRILTRSRWQLVEAVVLPKPVPVLVRKSGRVMVIVLDPDQGAPVASWEAEANARALRSFGRGERMWTYLAVDSSGADAVLTDVNRTVLLPLTRGKPSSHQWAQDTAASLWEFAPRASPFPPSAGARPSG